ncbi:hypothetical protein GCM10022276_19240 [Sphingomonas limnosediminicola]|uniref:Uncharacterized protein n=1 Tax=Sphingomonas limnosediminicola TaxID=940133 RepID=A0ABP7LHB3_9SPHN
MERDSGQEAERLAKIRKTEGANERLVAFFDRPAFGRVHALSPCHTAVRFAYPTIVACDTALGDKVVEVEDPGI